jgi:hypothetical protein
MRRLVLAVALALAVSSGTWAQDDLTDLKAQLEAAKKLIQQLEQRVQTLESQQAKPAAAAPAPAAAAPAPAAAAVPAAGPVVAPNQVPETGVADAGKARLEIYGFAQADFIYDFNRVDPDWNATLRPSKIPVNCPGDAGCGKDGETIFSVRQSRLGFNGFLPTSQGELKTKFEFDLFGVGDDAGQTTIRVRHVYGELGPFLAGQTNSLFMDGDVFPNTIDYWGPGGMIFFRTVQGRWTPWTQDGMKVSVALESPGAAIDVGNAVNPDGWQAHNKFPDLTGQFRMEPAWGHFQAAGILRYLGFENPTLPGISDASGSVTGYGLNLSGSYKLGGGKNKLMGQLAFGKGIAAYFNDCCVDIAPNGALTDAEAVPAVGWLVYYDHYWNEKFSSSIGWSQQIQNNTGGQAGNAFHRGDYASANLLFYPVKNVMTGVELLYGKRENKDGESGDDSRVQFSAKYNF